MITKIALLGKNCVENRKILDDYLPPAEWETGVWLPGEPDEDLFDLARKVDVMVPAGDVLMSRRLFPALAQCRKLKLLQIPFAGHDWLKPERLPRGAVACNVTEHASTVAEFVIHGILEQEIRLCRIDADFRSGSWKYSGSVTAGAYHGEIREKTLGIIGYGNIGRELAKRAAAFDMRVIAIARNSRPAEEPLAWLGGRADLDRLLDESDYLVLACSLTDETRGLLGESELGRMKDTAILANVSRGPVVDEQALFTALKHRRIRGAFIDVWYAYPTRENPAPLPSRFPFHELDNVIMTPHCAGRTMGGDARRWKTVGENLRQWKQGKPLKNIVMDHR